ncbi:hypothetical protein [Amycolatopsis taiwanensis]|uniref:Uncharacterized protein n=1 Tax=Amycolatopsis taiwanensis TaxID=342230 RepID=A0A9W6R556_9PSEU|nr:hypothetical protein [Amycolatopsis taiwanensis]GLY68833.1 hypothetical protein Atai01_54520 [Amycolatopsis taiwanensis]
MTAGRRLLARLATLLLVAVLALLLGGPAPVALAQGGDPFAGLAAQIQAEEQKVAAHDQRKADLETQIDGHNDKVATHDEAVEALDGRASAHSANVDSLNQRIAAHNAEPHVFQLPQQAGQSAAYDAEAAELNSEKAQLDAEGAQLQSEKSQLDNEGSQLDAEEQQQRAQVTAFNQEGLQLAAECQQLLQSLAAALDSPAGVPRAAPAPGGDQGRPTPALAQQPRQVAGDGGDPVSRVRQNEALDAYGKANGVEVDKRPVWARLTPGAVRNLPPSASTTLHVTRTYDGLVRKPTGRYRALVVPSPTTGITPGQKGFDDAVRTGGPAVATRDGQQIIIDEVVTVPGKPVTAPTTNCGADCNLVSGGTPTTATVSPRKLLDDAKALHDTVPASRDRYITVATGQLGGDLVYSVNQNGTNKAMRDLAAQLGYRRVFATDLNREVDTDAEQILFNAIDEGEEVGDGIIAASRPACGPDRQDCAGRALDYPNIQLWEQPRNR